MTTDAVTTDAVTTDVATTDVVTTDVVTADAVTADAVTGPAGERARFGERTVRLVGERAYARLESSLVAVVGLGGVGGHCAETLARAGVGRLHLVDCDLVAPSNLNRQLVATRETIGLRKTDALRARIESVSGCLVTTSYVRVGPDTVQCALPEGAAFVADAIDTLTGKLALVAWARAAGVPIVSCMGAGNRLDPEKLAVKDIFDTENDPLARNMRRALRKLGVTALPVVCSAESAARAQGAGESGAAGQRVIASFAPVTGSAGLLMAAYILRALMKGEDGT